MGVTALILLNVVTIGGVVVGALQSFLGYRLLKVTVVFTGFLIGFLIFNATIVVIPVNVDNNVIYGIVAGLLGGIVLVVLFHFLAPVFTFFVGVSGGFALGVLVSSIFPVESTAVLVTGLILGVILGVVALFLQKLVFVISTSFVGAGLVVLGIARLIDGPPANGTNVTQEIAAVFFNPIFNGGALKFSVLIPWTLLSILGIIVQYRLTREKSKSSQ